MQNYIIEKICTSYGNDHHRMLDILLEIQPRFRHINYQTMAIVAKQLGRTRIEVEGVASADVIAIRFHRGLIDIISDLAIDLAQNHGLDTVCLGGGSFQNKLLLTGISDVLICAGLKVLTPGRIPANDSGLSFGQGLIASAQLIDNLSPQS